MKKRHTPESYGNLLLSDQDFVLSEIRRMGKLIKANRMFPSEEQPQSHRPGISVIVPTFCGSGRISRALDSLAAQSLPRDLFEVVVIMNGPVDGTESVIDDYVSRFPDLEIRTISTTRSGAGRARNLGLRLASRNYVTFLDDDDYLGSEFLASMWKHAGPEVIVVAPIIDVEEDGKERRDTALNRSILRLGARKCRPANHPAVFGFNACKLIPTTLALSAEYMEDMPSGEDVCYMAAVAVAGDSRLVLSGRADESSYYRVKREDSVSRRELSHQFSVTDRISVIAQLEKTRGTASVRGAELVDSLIRSQAGFITRYLEHNPEAYGRIAQEIEAKALRFFPWGAINRGRARDLVISYCFPPFADTSAVVAVKAVLERGRIVDAISCDMGKVRSRNNELQRLVDPLIDQRIVLQTPVSFANWEALEEFAEKSMAAANNLTRQKGDYDTIYSRALWVGSHFAAAAYKSEHPETRWTAEFSDPLSRGAEGNVRQGTYSGGPLLSLLKRSLRRSGFQIPRTKNLFELAEYITYVLADELIFTNENQLRYMLSYLGDAKLVKLVESKAIVRPHPTLDGGAYEIVQSDLEVDHRLLNIGYFGNFYQNRSLDDVLTAIANLPAEAREKVKLSIFTDVSQVKQSLVEERGLGGNVVFRSMVPYLEFLNLSKKFDVLLVNDVTRPAAMPINPFLPSKLSDYRGSGSKIWGLIDEGSPLSFHQLDYASPVENAPAVISTLTQILSDWRNDRAGNSGDSFGIDRRLGNKLP